VWQGAWTLIRYFLAQDAPPSLPGSKAMETKTTHPKIIQIGDAYFQEQGPRRIKSVLDRLAMGKLSVPWLRDVFCRMAADPKYGDFNLGTWDEFACDEAGKPVVYELLFQLRLYLANKYRESIVSTRETKA
jgi:hypothetical protein